MNEFILEGFQHELEKVATFANLAAKVGKKAVKPNSTLSRWGQIAEQTKKATGGARTASQAQSNYLKSLRG